MSNAEKLKALKLTMDKIDKDFGKGSVMMMNEKGQGAMEVISTGSIGRQTVDVLAAHPEAFRVVALATGSNGALLAEQSAQLRPVAVALADDDAVRALDRRAGLCHAIDRAHARPC